MTPEQRLGQLFITGFSGTEIPQGSLLARMFEEHEPGGVILFERCLHSPGKEGNIRSRQQLCRLTAALQSMSRSPLLICIDQEGGAVQRLKAEKGFIQTASAKELGQHNTCEFTLAESCRAAAQLAELGINVNFAPVVDLDAAADNPIIGKIGRAFSAHPEQVATHAQAWIDGHRRHRVLSCLKHFPGHGSAACDSHLGFVDISASWEERELQPYRALIAGGNIDMIMTGHLFNRFLDPDAPATLSEKIITGLLRENMHFDGVVVTDDMQMKAITDRYGFAESIQRAVAAGVDMIVIGNNLDYNEYAVRDGINAVREGLDAGRISEARVAAALARIQRLKQRSRSQRNGS